ncbi:piggyBac transposable element-derived protein 3-like [Macrobrachium rosenbergii]|uniref:piggyBac transposable element-derived protein 3-like n=1 Tax=Macrobrachium rosenbergii TaxID=79674 RepID=UPI0034D39E1A
MVAYMGTRAGNVRQYICKKPDKWCYKFFCRASIDGIIHGILMYQGWTTFIAHTAQLPEEEALMNMSAKVVTALLRIVKHPNFFTSIGLVEHMRDTCQCCYVGIARETRTGNPGLIPTAQLNSKKTKRGTINYRSCNGVLALNWKDNKVVNTMSIDAGVEPLASVKRYDRDAKEKVDVPCPDVIKQYNSKMVGIDKSDMLTHLYKTPLRSRC